MMERKSYSDFVASGFLQQTAFYLQQSDPECDIEVDPYIFLAAFTYVNERGERVNVNPSILDLFQKPESRSLLDRSFSPQIKKRNEEILEKATEEWNEMCEVQKAKMGNLRGAKQTGEWFLSSSLFTIASEMFPDPAASSKKSKNGNRGKKSTTECLSPRS